MNRLASGTTPQYIQTCFNPFPHFLVLNVHSAPGAYKNGLPAALLKSRCSWQTNSGGLKRKAKLCRISVFEQAYNPPRHTRLFTLLIRTKCSTSCWRIFDISLARAVRVLSGFPDTDTFCIDIEQIFSRTEDIHQCPFCAFNGSF